MFVHTPDNGACCVISKCIVTLPVYSRIIYNFNWRFSWTHKRRGLKGLLTLSNITGNLKIKTARCPHETEIDLRRWLPRHISGLDFVVPYESLVIRSFGFPFCIVCITGDIGFIAITFTNVRLLFKRI